MQYALHDRLLNKYNCTIIVLMLFFSYDSSDLAIRINKWYHKFLLLVLRIKYYEEGKEMYLAHKLFFNKLFILLTKEVKKSASRRVILNEKDWN